MHIFVCEFISGGGQFGYPDPQLLPEGQRMAASLVNDLMALQGVTVLLARDPCLAQLRPDVPECRPTSAQHCWAEWRQAAQACDAAWIIAPETNGILARLVEDFTQAGIRVLNADAPSIRLTGSKLATFDLLNAAHLPTIPTVMASASLPPSSTGWVAKPDDGAGADDMMICDDPSVLNAWLDQADRRQTHVVQPFIPGTPASASTLMAAGQASVLSVNSQRMIGEGGEMTYGGGIVGGMEGYRAQIQPIASRIARVAAGLWGPVGVDFIITSRDNVRGGEIVVVEINPRLTTPWVGLAQALGRNPDRKSVV